MKRILKWTGIILLSVVVVLCLLNRKLAYYGWVQAKGQIGIILHARSVEKVLTDPEFPDSLKLKLKEINQVKEFAGRVLGLNVNKNYTTYYDQGKENLMWVLSACPPYKLQAYAWRFPILGTFSYKGFFNRKMAFSEEKKLRDQGYDTDIRTAGGWSTLGILKDPVLSDMLDRNETQLADLIIHELTHGTIFIRDSVEFNENLATFIGHYGTLEYLRSKYGNNSKEVNDYLTLLSDRRTYNRYMLHACNQLDSLYGSFAPLTSADLKNELKSEMIARIVHNLDTVNFSREYAKGGFFTDGMPNNTYFMSFLRYRGLQEYFMNEYSNKFHKDLPGYIRFLKTEFGKSG